MRGGAVPCVTFALLALSGCAATVERSVHESAIAEQREAYEDRLRRADDERRRADKTCADQRDAAERAAKTTAERAAELESALADRQRTLDDVTAQLLELQDAFSKVSTKERTQIEAHLAKERGREAVLGELRTRMTEALKAELDEKKAEIFAKDDVLTIRLKDGLVFTKGSSKLAQTSKATLDRLAVALKAAPDGPIRIEVHTDSVRPQDGDSRDTWALTQQQGLTLATALAKAGVDPSRLSYTSFGQYRPIATNDTAEGRAENRRVDLLLPIVRR